MTYYNLEQELQFEMEEEKIKIDPNDNVCSVCGKPFKHYKYYVCENGGMLKSEIKSVVFRTSHAGCNSLVEKIKKLKDELLDLEFKLFCKRA
jgi:hypothetical protein